MGHSKLPWRINSDGHAIDATGERIVLTGFAIMGSASYKETATGNRDISVTAVNVMPEMMTLLRAVAEGQIKSRLRMQVLELRAAKILKQLEAVDG